MKSITTTVRELGAGKRESLESVLGHKLLDNEKVIIQVVPLDDDEQSRQREQAKVEGTAPQLPAWCDVYEDLSDDEIADLEAVILQRANLNRR